MQTIAVIGSGVIGLSTAINIQKLLPGAKVTVIADRFNDDTTSIGAGAIFLPNSSNIPGVPEETLRKWCETSWRYFSGLISSGMSKTTGVTVTSGYLLENKPIQRPLYADLVYTYRDLTQDEAYNISRSLYRYGSMISTILIDMTRYLPWLMIQFLANGGAREVRKINHIKELNGSYDIVVNCTGLGSRYLFNDMEVYPVRGQLVRVEAPWIKNFIYTDHHAYILPNFGRVLLGGTKQEDNYNLDIDHTDRLGILNRCHTLCPALKGAKIIDEWVGLRPKRSAVRVEAEKIKLAIGQLTVIHNYGHGSSGVALSWGTAVEAAKIVKDCLSNQSAKL